MPPCCVLYTTRQPLGAQVPGMCSWSIITRTSGVGLCQRAAGGPLSWYALARLVSWRMRRREGVRTHTRTRVCRAQQHERIYFQSHHTVAAASVAERSGAPRRCAKRRPSVAAATATPIKKMEAGADAVVFVAEADAARGYR